MYYTRSPATLVVNANFQLAAVTLSQPICNDIADDEELGRVDGEKPLFTIY